MQKLCFVLFTFGLIFATQIQSIDNSQIASIFDKLKHSKIGTNIYTTIMLELQTSSSEHVVDKILQLLYNLKEEASSTIEDAQEDLDKHKSTCASKPEELQSNIEDLKNKIAISESVIPGKSQELYSKKSNRQQEIELKQSADNDLEDLIQANEDQKTDFERKQEQHSKMIDALKQAKELIKKLETSPSGFIEVSDNDIEALKKHAKVASSLKMKHHKAIFKFLMQLTTEVSMKADQEKVRKVLAIIDDLIAHEQDFKRVEADAESKRLILFDFQKKSALRNIRQIEAMIQQLDADIKLLEVQLNELRTDIANYRKEIQNKNQQLTDMANMCEDNIAEIEDFICARNEELDVIKQVILIFESKSIQDIKKEINLQA